ncbi:MAG: hypothetical protein HF978_14450 [Desulfobacteraceae bacterium]|nr:hypothetical protein [Desulfobacteraceae bacterium]MBC2756740.1 hypothetical protein [Desulfobacteraceae bacterium]
MPDIKNIEIKTLCNELRTDYALSYGVLTCFESVVVTIELDDETLLYGEVTPLTGYTEETVESSIDSLNQFAKAVIGKSVEFSLNFFDQHIGPENSFAMSSLVPPIESYQRKFGHVAVRTKDLIQSIGCSNKTIGNIKYEINTLYEKGFRVFKIKFGRDVQCDIETIYKLSELDLKDIRLRFDANCGFTFNQSVKILKLLSLKLPDHAEYLEQPLPRHRWEEVAQINKLNLKIPQMLDESIYTESDIIKSYDAGVHFIKLKLCKFGSISRLEHALELAKKSHMNVVIGNGVASDISNYYELVFYYQNKHRIFGASESVGFLRLKNQIKYNIMVEK